MITHDGLSEGALESLRLSCQANLHFVEVSSEAGYYAAKNEGFKASSGEIVVFADSDCLPESSWLESLLSPFEDGAQVVAGRTCYRSDLLGIAATTIDFLYFEPPQAPGTTLNFYANNVAFAREVFGARLFPKASMYRGHCQKLGMQLTEDGISIRFAPSARTVHRFPDHWTEFLQLRLLRGRDLGALAPPLVDRYAPALTMFSRSAMVPPALVWCARGLLSQRALGAQQMPAVGGARAAATRALIAGISVVDGVGTLLSGAQLIDRGHSLDRQALSYHRG